MKIIDKIVKNIPGGDENGHYNKYGDRKHVSKPDMIIIHGTGCKSFEAAMEKLYAANETISAHYIIKEDGTIYRMVPEDKRAYHAGYSAWNSLSDKFTNTAGSDINSRSIGIEISNRHEAGNKERNPYTKEQIKSVIELCTYLKDKYDIPTENVIGHADIAPDRKQDPWHNFPWKTLAKHGLGLWPETKLGDYFNNEAYKNNPEKVSELLETIGYNTDTHSNGQKATFNQLVTAFQTHYEPKLKNKGEVRNSTIAKMKALARMSEEIATERNTTIFNRFAIEPQVTIDLAPSFAYASASKKPYTQIKSIDMNVA